MSYVIAIAGVGAACVTWYWVQRWSGALEEAERPEDCAGCSACEPDQAEPTGCDRPELR